ncbi:BolA family protein [Bartonella sp. LJL80]
MSSTVAETIEKKLHAAFSPKALEVINESHLHAGHHHDDGRSFDGSGETHFRVKIVAKDFDGMKRVDIHRAINHVLKHELDNGVHALAIEAKAV